MGEVYELGKGNMSALEEKVDMLIRYCIADTDSVRRSYQVDLVNLLQKQPQQPSADVAECVEAVLSELCIPDHLLGYSYLGTALELAVLEPDVVHYVTGMLYPKIAQRHGTTDTLVERAMRHGIQCAWNRCPQRVWAAYFSTDRRPTNAEFVARVANRLRRQLLK